MSGENVGQISMDVPAQFGDSSSNGSRDMRLPHFVTNDNDAGVCRSSHKGKTDQDAANAICLSYYDDGGSCGCWSLQTMAITVGYYSATL